MRHKKIKKEYVKYVVVEKETKIAFVFRFKNQVSDKIGVSVRTLDRKMPYENEKYLVMRVENFYF